MFGNVAPVVLKKLMRKKPMIENFDFAWNALVPLITLGFTIGVVLAVIFGAIRIGWSLAPWIVIGALLVWFFN